MFDYRTSDALILFPCRLRFGCLSVGEKIKTHTPNQTRARSFRYRFLSCLMHVLCAYIYILCVVRMCAPAHFVWLLVWFWIAIKLDEVKLGQRTSANILDGMHLQAKRNETNKRTSKRSLARARSRESHSQHALGVMVLVFRASHKSKQALWVSSERT